MTNVKQSAERRRVRVAVRVQTDWERFGCRHFLTRQAYEANKVKSTSTTSESSSRLAGVAARRIGSMEMVITLAIVVGLLWCLRRLTQSIGGGPLLAVERLLRGVGRLVLRKTWSEPARRVGVAMTLWLWLVGFTALLAAFALFTWQVESLPLVAALCALIVVVWRMLRWWARRRYRVRVLPDRRRGR